MNKHIEKICVITSSRSDYWLLEPLLSRLVVDPTFSLQLIVTGAHLSPEFGLTYKDIEKKFKIERKIEILASSDTAVGISTSIGLGLIRFSEAFRDLNPDLILVLGDRYEILAAATAAMIACIPLAHIHGGELTLGAVDDAIRHSITKMSHLHFVATEVYRKRVIQLGEKKEFVYQVGGLGVDCISNIKLMDRSELESQLGLKFYKKNFLITFHPATIELGSGYAQTAALLSALSSYSDVLQIFTAPSADAESRETLGLIEDYCSRNENAHLFRSMGHLKYFSTIATVDAVIGNSSSGILEVPTFKKPTVNIGDRQKGRIKAASIVDCMPNEISISSAIDFIFTPSFQDKLKDVKNPYGSGGAVDKIMNVIKSINIKDLMKKEFQDL